MKMGYDISIIPARVAFLMLMEEPINNSAKISAAVSAATNNNNLCERAIASKSRFSKPPADAIINMIIAVTEVVIPSEEMTEIFL